MKNSFFCIDAHTCGNPVRLVAGGAPMLPHLPIAERRELFVERHDWVRQALMFEPRGHDVMSGAILYPPYRDDCDVAVLFIEVSGCLPMCGAGTIGLVTSALQEGLVTPRVPGKLALETPAGRVDVEYRMQDGRVSSVKMLNVTSYLHATDVTVEIEGVGRLSVDIAYGGNYYAVVEPQSNWPGLEGAKASTLIALSQKLRSALASVIDPVHPLDERIRGVHHVIWCDQPDNPQVDGRCAVFYGEQAIDRSPGGTGTSARMAQLHGRGRLAVGQDFRHQSLIGTTFTGRVEAQTTLGAHTAIQPSVTGWARVTGYNTILVDDEDPLAHGFQIT
ncbi:4-hydroxyproline epimerase [Pseudomonas asplenii]|uniref:4-hydroxyproline epimerase n=1 Tax=Pseudomonas asplenii TaxID=53407 RepID=UPI0006B675EC|nr:4-hydroxyproline epimerase [Pseudomonas fuscovaginae]KPA95502.1 proline racemase [Pseudomonas fuscovaginae]